MKYKIACTDIFWVKSPKTVKRFYPFAKLKKYPKSGEANLNLQVGETVKYAFYKKDNNEYKIIINIFQRIE